MFIFQLLVGVYSNSDASQYVVLFNNMLSTKDWVIRDNNSTESVLIDIMKDGRCRIATFVDHQVHKQILNNINVDEFYKTTRKCFRATSIMNNMDTVTINDFDSYNTRYKLFINREHPNGTDVILNCNDSETFFVEVYVNNINSIKFNNTNRISLKSVTNHSNTPLTFVLNVKELERRDKDGGSISAQRVIFRPGTNNTGW